MASKLCTIGLPDDIPPIEYQINPVFDPHCIRQTNSMSSDFLFVLNAISSIFYSISVGFLLIEKKESINVNDYMILIVFDHANACASMCLLVKIHNTSSCQDVQISPIWYRAYLNLTCVSINVNF